MARPSAVFFATLFCLAASPAIADAVTDPVPGHPGITFEILLKQVMPDLAGDKDGTWTGTVAALRGTDDKPGVDTQLAFGDVSALAVTEGGRKRLLILTGDSRSDSGFDAVLAAFDDTGPRPRFLDDMDVGGDRFVMSGSPPLLAIASGTDAFIVNSNHFNSNQNYTECDAPPSCRPTSRLLRRADRGIVRRAVLPAGG
ncbi:MAG TPA: hypothetical protein VII56_08150 [Rhizomicrobium sp.]